MKPKWSEFPRNVYQFPNKLMLLGSRAHLPSNYMPKQCKYTSVLVLSLEQLVQCRQKSGIARVHSHHYLVCIAHNNPEGNHCSTNSHLVACGGKKWHFKHYQLYQILCQNNFSNWHYTKDVGLLTQQ